MAFELVDVAATPEILQEYDLFDASDDVELQAVVRVAAVVAGVPTAALNLLTKDEQCPVTTVGFAGVRTPRSQSMCGISLQLGGFVHVPDARQSDIFGDNVWVTGELGGIRFYAAAPLITSEGGVLGTLCVFGDEPKSMSDEERARLEDLAQVVLGLFERRRQNRRQALLVEEAEQARQEVQAAHEKLAAHNRFVQAVLDTIEVAVLASDSEGRLTMGNRAAREWHGMDAIGMPAEGQPEAYRLLEPDGITPLAPERIPLHRALHEGVLRGAEMVIAPPEQPPQHVVASGRALIGPSGEPTGAVVALTDVTADRAQRQALQQALADLAERTLALDETVAELQRSNADLQQFAAVAGHDLAAPLGVVGGYVQMVAEEYEGCLDAQAQAWLATASGGVARMRGLIDALLSYAQAGAAPLAREVTPAQEVFDLAVLDLRSTTAGTGATITAPVPLPTLICDPVQLRQLLQNLLSNSVRFRHPDRHPRITCAATRGVGVWTFTVTDNGVGIPQERREDVFSMFQRGTTAVPGHGIGLATCARIVERHGGRIWVSSASGAGTSISFTIPDRPTVGHVPQPRAGAAAPAPLLG